MAVPTSQPRGGTGRTQLTLWTGCPPHCAPAGLLGVRADSVVPPRGMEHPPSPFLGAPPKATEPLLLRARPPRGPLAHFTLRWQERREEGEKEREVEVTSGYPRMPQGSPPTCSLPEPEAGGIFGPEARKTLGQTPQGCRGRGCRWGISRLSLPLPGGPTPLARSTPTNSPGLLHSMVPLAAAEPSGQAG